MVSYIMKHPVYIDNFFQSEKKKTLAHAIVSELNLINEFDIFTKCQEVSLELLQRLWYTAKSATYVYRTT